MAPQASDDQFAIGDEVILTEKTIVNEELLISAKVVDIREVLGKKTYVIETGTGKRKVVGAKQIIKAE